VEGIEGWDARHLSYNFFLGYDGTLPTSNNEREHSYTKLAPMTGRKSWFALESNGGRKGIGLAGVEGWLFLFSFCISRSRLFCAFWAPRPFCISFRGKCLVGLLLSSSLLFFFLYFPSIY
jgi:hypothetical protein